MAVFENVRPAPFGAVSIHRAVVAFDNVVTAFRRWNETRRTVAALRSLSPAQLNDIGLEGVDLVQFAETLPRR